MSYQICSFLSFCLFRSVHTDQSLWCRHPCFTCFICLSHPLYFSRLTSQSTSSMKPLLISTKRRYHLHLNLHNNWPVPLVRFRLELQFTGVVLSTSWSTWTVSHSSLYTLQHLEQNLAQNRCLGSHDMWSIQSWKGP